MEKERTFEFAKSHFVKRELKDYLTKLKKLELLSDEHAKHLESLGAKSKSRTRIVRKKGSKKKSKGKTKSLNDKDRGSSIKSQIKKMKKKSSKQSKSTTATIPENTSTDPNPTAAVSSPGDTETETGTKPEIVITKVPSLDHHRNSVKMLPSANDETNAAITEPIDS